MELYIETKLFCQSFSISFSISKWLTKTYFSINPVYIGSKEKDREIGRHGDRERVGFKKKFT